MVCLPCWLIHGQIDMSQCMTKPRKWHVHPAKTQISPVLSESAVHMTKPWIRSYPLSAQQILRSGWSKSSLGAHAILLVLSCTGSYLSFRHLLIHKEVPIQVKQLIWNFKPVLNCLLITKFWENLHSLFAERVDFSICYFAWIFGHIGLSRQCSCRSNVQFDQWLPAQEFRHPTNELI